MEPMGRAFGSFLRVSGLGVGVEGLGHRALRGFSELLCDLYRFEQVTFVVVPDTHRLHSSSFLGLPYRILRKMNRKKELLWSL